MIEKTRPPEVTVAETLDMWSWWRPQRGAGLPLEMAG